MKQIKLSINCFESIILNLTRNLSRLCIIVIYRLQSYITNLFFILATKYQAN